MKRISYILLALLAVACGGANKQTSEPQEAVVENKDSVVVYEHDYLVKVGDLAPDFTLNYTDGNEFTLSQLRGKVVMLQFTRMKTDVMFSARKVIRV